jgi:hypothetical protein
MRRHRQRTIYFAFSIAVCLTLVSTHLRAGTHLEFQTGKLLDVSSDERLYEGTTHRYAVYQVQLSDVVYSARGEKLRRYSGDPGHGLVVGDTVQVAIDGDNLILQRPDGKQIKAKIIKRRRPDTTIKGSVN